MKVCMGAIEYSLLFDERVVCFLWLYLFFFLSWARDGMVQMTLDVIAETICGALSHEALLSAAGGI